MFFKFVAGRPHEFADEQHIGALTEDDLCLAIPPLRRRARSLTKDDSSAEDLLQNTLARAWANRHTFERGQHEPLAWLREIMRNQFYDGCRAATRSPLRFTDDEAVLHAVEVSGAQYERTLLNEVVAFAEPQTAAVLEEELTKTETIKKGRRRIHADVATSKTTWREHNRERVRANAKAYRERNREKIIEQKRIWRELNSEELNAKKRAKRAAKTIEYLKNGKT